MSAEPFFSVLIASYNRPEYLGKCLRSIFCGDYAEFEVVVADDCSPDADKIKKIAESYKGYSNFSFYANQKKMGMANNWNFLAQKAKGKYLLYIGDDELLPHTLKELNECIQKFPNYDFYGFGYNVMDENGEFCYSRVSPSAFEITHCSKFLNSALCFDIIPFWVFHPFSICYDRKVCLEVKYREDVGIGSDFLFLFDSINQGKKMLVMPEPLFMWRKAQRMRNCQYKNLSGMNWNSILARKMMLYTLEQRKDICSNISTLISSYYFRKRFLYDPIVIDKSIDGSNMCKLNLRKEHLEELMGLYSSGNYLFHQIRIKLHRAFDYLRLFGLKGIFGLLLLGYYEIRFAIKKSRLDVLHF